MVLSFKKRLKTEKTLHSPNDHSLISYACTELNQSWQGYTLLAAYFFSYLPQMLGFILYVLPSTAFSEKFRQTIIDKVILRQRQLSTTRQEKPDMKTRLTKCTVPTVASS